MAAMLPTGIGQTHRRTWHHQDMTIETEQRAAAQELAAWTSSLELADVPAEVAIDEAVEAAKVFCGSEAPGFVNGILGGVVRELASSREGSA